MSLALLILVMLAIFCLFLLLSLPWVLQSSAEAERMFSLVQSTREDKRRIGHWERLTTLLAGRTSTLRTTLGKRANAKMLKRFAEAGLRSPHIADLFLWSQGLGMVCGAGLGLLVPSSPLVWSLIGGFVGFTVPDFWLGSKQRRRRQRLRRSVPDMVDLLVICVGAGLGLDQALLRVTKDLQLSHPDLSEELARLSLERGAGAGRIDAWRSLADRMRLEEITAFVRMLAETERFGSPVVAALAQFSDELRTKRRQHAEEAAAKTKVKIIFPLVICIFPCIFIVLLVPAVLSFFHSFSTMTR